MALTQDRETLRRDGRAFMLPVAADTRIFAGAIVGVTSTGHAVPAGTNDVVGIVGVAQEQADNRNDHEGARFISVSRGTFAFKQSGTAITRAHVGKAVTAIDDETVSLIDPNANAPQIVAGIVRDVDSDGVWVEF